MISTWLRLTLSTVFVLIVTACASVPVQEMSDARQALKAAEMAGAAEYAPDVYKEAKQLVADADFFISQRRYEVARVVADRAKLIAIKARRTALNNKDTDEVK